MSVLYFGFNASDRIWIRGKAYRAVARLLAGHLLVHEDAPRIRVYSDVELDELVSSDLVRVERNAFRQDALPPSMPAAAAPPALDLSPRGCEQLIRREMYRHRFVETGHAAQSEHPHALIYRAIAILQAELSTARRPASLRLSDDRQQVGSGPKQRRMNSQPPSPRTLRRWQHEWDRAGEPTKSTSAPQAERPAK